MGIIVILFFVAIFVGLIAGTWKMFEKAGEPGWKCLIPFYGFWILMEISGKPGWWMFFVFVPFGYLVVKILAMIGLAQRFGKSEGFVVGLVLLPFIFYPILGFGDAEYEARPAPAI